MPFLSHEAISVTISPGTARFLAPTLYDSAKKHASGQYRLWHSPCFPELVKEFASCSAGFSESGGQLTREKEEGPMRCTKCEGLMVVDDLIDMRESYHPMWMRGWRCVACGNVVDPLILRNRMIQEAGTLSLLKVEAPSQPVYFRPAKVSA